VSERLLAADVPLRGSQGLTLYTRPRGGGLYELWVVGRYKTAGVIDHHFTRTDVASVLGYAAPGDLRWRSADLSEIPAKTMGHGFVAGSTVPVDKVIDYDPPHYHLASGINGLPLDRSAFARARKDIAGNWTDSVVSLMFGADSALQVVGTPGDRHPLFWAQPIPDTWSFSSWQLWLMHRRTKGGIKVTVLHVSDSELHIAQAPPTQRGEPALIAHVFTRRSDGP
jgi:hypothetical protein